MAKYRIEVVVPEGLTAGDTFQVEVEIEKKTNANKPRGTLAGVPLEDMSLEQLKRAKINVSSVIYKAKQRGAKESDIMLNEERLARINELLEQKKPEKVPQLLSSELVPRDPYTTEM